MPFGLYHCFCDRCISRGLNTAFTCKTLGCGLYTGAAYTSIYFQKLGRFGNFSISFQYNFVFYLNIVIISFLRLHVDKVNLIFTGCNISIRQLAKMASTNFDMDFVGEYEFNSPASMPYVPQ